jgi:hypothetical protein
MRPGEGEAVNDLEHRDVDIVDLLSWQTGEYLLATGHELNELQARDDVYLIAVRAGSTLVWDVMGAVRRALERHFPAPGDPKRGIVDRAVAVIVRSLFGGHYVSARLGGRDHWFNRVVLGKVARDVDLTWDLGYESLGDESLERIAAGKLATVQASAPGRMWVEGWPRLRSPEEVGEDAVRLAKEMLRLRI